MRNGRKGFAACGVAVRHIICTFDSYMRARSQIDTIWSMTMRYRVYSGPRGSENLAPTDRDRQLYKEFDGLDEALSWARHLDDTGRVALLIEGDDGTSLDRRAIANELVHRGKGGRAA
jgi:hypothetical protein